MADAWNLDRFVAAQSEVYGQIVGELRAGCKRTHWMWFIFPQVAGLGSSSTSRGYAITSLNEARAYLDHPTLGPTLVACTRLIITADKGSATEILGAIDSMKFRSCMTLFRRAARPNSDVEQVFRLALGKYFAGEEDPATLALLGDSIAGR